MNTPKRTFSFERADPRERVDSSRAQALFEAYYQETFAAGGYMATPADRQRIHDYFFNEVLKDPQTRLVFDPNGELIACAGAVPYYPNGGHGLPVVEIRSVAVHPDHRGWGVSTQLIGDIENSVGSLPGCEHGAQLVMISRNPRIIGSAEKRGYRSSPIAEWYRFLNLPEDLPEVKAMEQHGFRCLLKTSVLEKPTKGALLKDLVNGFRKKFGL